MTSYPLSLSLPLSPMSTHASHPLLSSGQSKESIQEYEEAINNVGQSCGSVSMGSPLSSVTQSLSLSLAASGPASATTSMAPHLHTHPGVQSTQPHIPGKRMSCSHAIERNQMVLSIGHYCSPLSRNLYISCMTK